MVTSNVKSPLKVCSLRAWSVMKLIKTQTADGLAQMKLSKTFSSNIVSKKTGEKVIIGPSESMSKSKKNTVDPEKMIKRYGADAVRWFVLSDSPPDKDIQWSDQGINASYKFLQKLWDLNQRISERKERKVVQRRKSIHYEF